ncbi:MAG: hypothetical protein HWN66_01090 [Candidatus Helarchaeota archaeon]|nr:hypothetical protein [Candidatus Helarchaeota archaeon]
METGDRIGLAGLIVTTAAVLVAGSMDYIGFHDFLILITMAVGGGAGIIICIIGIANNGSKFGIGGLILSSVVCVVAVLALLGFLG